jgi:hypothetical protein
MRKEARQAGISDVLIYNASWLPKSSPNASRISKK